ncbi:MAG: hypothetical protein IKS67_06260, partial [Victivallales bacterium]|nr:hypothetical protein [Victivallales bacterium]
STGEFLTDAQGKEVLAAAEREVFDFKDVMELGSITYKDYTQKHIDAVKAKAIDTTGAGDSWAAGFFHAWLDGKSLEAAGKLGAKVSAEIVQVAGARLPDATWQSLREYYNTLS